jgi:type II secretory pathway component PulM
MPELPTPTSSRRRSIRSALRELGLEHERLAAQRTRRTAMQIVDSHTFTEDLPWLQGRDKELVMGDASCDWLGWKRPA